MARKIYIKNGVNLDSASIIPGYKVIGYNIGGELSNLSEKNDLGDIREIGGGAGSYKRVDVRSIGYANGDSYVNFDNYLASKIDTSSWDSKIKPLKYDLISGTGSLISTGDMSDYSTSAEFKSYLSSNFPSDPYTISFYYYENSSNQSMSILGRNYPYWLLKGNDRNTGGVGNLPLSVSSTFKSSLLTAMETAGVDGVLASDNGLGICISDKSLFYTTLSGNKSVLHNDSGLSSRSGGSYFSNGNNLNSIGYVFDNTNTLITKPVNAFYSLTGYDIINDKYIPVDLTESYLIEYDLTNGGILLYKDLYTGGIPSTRRQIKKQSGQKSYMILHKVFIQDNLQSYSYYLIQPYDIDVFSFSNNRRELTDEFYLKVTFDGDNSQEYIKKVTLNDVPNPWYNSDTNFTSIIGNEAVKGCLGSLTGYDIFMNLPSSVRSAFNRRIGKLKPKIRIGYGSNGVYTFSDDYISFSFVGLRSKRLQMSVNRDIHSHRYYDGT